MLLFAQFVAWSRLAPTMSREMYSVSPGGSDGRTDLSQFCDRSWATLKGGRREGSVVQFEPLQLPVQRGAADAESLGGRRNIAARAQQRPLQHGALTAGEVVARNIAAE